MERCDESAALKTAELAQRMRNTETLEYTGEGSQVQQGNLIRLITEVEKHQGQEESNGAGICDRLQFSYCRTGQEAVQLIAMDIQDAELHKFFSRIVKLTQGRDFGHETIDSLQRLHLILRRQRMISRLSADI
ncbi:hypothetical protein CRUP_008287 [Coryphaenoides rupestris]|nr:hypothetical protein CRUP_008287 [Coryphaenoides rupestris]